GDDVTYDRIVPGRHERHMHVRMQIDDVLDFFRMHLQSANIDYALAPALKIVSFAPQFDQVTGIDKTIPIMEADVIAADETRCDAPGTDAQQLLLDAHLDLPATANIGLRETFEPVRDLEGNAGLRR